jgi:carbon storage regulator
MLVLTRKKGQSLMIGNEIEISIVDIQGDQVRIGINAPRTVSIHRKEVFEEIQQENRQASTVNLSQEELKKAVETLHLKKDKKPE